MQDGFDRADVERLAAALLALPQFVFARKYAYEFISVEKVRLQGRQGIPAVAKVQAF